MASQFNQYDWYWSVQDSSPSTQVYGTVPGAFVPLADANYVAWLAKDGGGNQPTIIDTYASLCGVINNFAIQNYVPSTKYLTLVANVTLTNPPPNLISVTNNTGASLKVIMPVANAPNSIPIGIPIVFKNVSVGAGAFAVGVYASDGTTLLSGLAGSIEPGMSITAVPAGNLNKLGGWDVRNSGNVSVSGIAVANQYAKWTSPYTIQGVAPSQVQQDIQAYPITGGVLTGNVTIQKSNPILTLWKAASGEQSAIEGRRSGGAGSMRWRLLLGDETNEPGSGNIGSDFRLDNYNDGGTFVGSPFSIGRATGNALFGANVQITGQLTANGTILVSKISPQIIVNKTASGQAAQIQGKTAANLRWVMNLGDNVAETGSNAGSNFTLDAYDDATNTLLSSPLTINRATGLVTIPKLASIQTGTYVPTILIGGASTGITYSTQLGDYTRVGNHIIFGGLIILTSKGSLTGAVTVVLPFAAAGWGAMTCVMNAASASGPTTGIVSTGVTAMAVNYFAGGNIAAVTEAQIGNGTIFYFGGTYRG